MGVMDFYPCRTCNTCPTVTQTKLGKVTLWMAECANRKCQIRPVLQAKSREELMAQWNRANRHDKGWY